MATKHPAVSASEEERTTVDPGGLDHWVDEKTVADPPSTATTDVVAEDPSTIEGADVVVVNRTPLGSESETVDELTVEERKAALRIPVNPLRSPAPLPEAILVVRTGPHEGQRFALSKTTMTIGRALDNDIVLVDSSISKRHLKIEFDGIGFFLQDLGSGNGTVINGRDEDHRYPLVDRDALELGRSIITFESSAMRAIKPAIEPPRPRPPRGKQPMPEPPPARPTLSLRGTGKHPEFGGEVDDEASTIAGQRLPGPELGASGAKLPPMKLGGAGPDLVMPRDPRQEKQARMTLASPAVPAPDRAGAAPRILSHHPTAARPSQPPPIIAPLSLDEEEPTRSAPNRNPTASAPPPAATHMAMRAQPSSDPPFRAQPSSAPPFRPQPSSAPPFRPSPSSSSPPLPRPLPGPSSHPPPIVYPTVSSPYHSGAVLALSPRSSQPPPFAGPGMMEPVAAPSSRKWIVLIALVAVATIIGVTAAAISERGGANGTAAASADAAPKEPIATALVDAGVLAQTGDAMVVAVLVTDAAATATVDAATVVAPIATLEDDLVGTTETLLASLGPASGNPTVPDDSGEADGQKTSETDGQKINDAGDPKNTKRNGDDDGDDDDDDDRTSGDSGKGEGDRDFVKKTLSQADAAYRDRNFDRAASLTRSAAAKASGREARTLKKRASSLGRMQDLLSSAAKADPVPAYIAYGKAKTLDRGLGKKHQQFLNIQLLRVGPDAARQYMVDGDLEAAARAVTVSRQVGDRSRTESTMSSLERKAADKVAAGKAAKKDGDDKTAKREWTAAKRILPTQSELYREVAALLADL